MNITIESGDDFTFNVTEYTQANLFGQTTSYTTGQNNTQDVVNGLTLESESTLSRLNPLSTFSTDLSSSFIEDLLISLGIEDESLIETATAAYDAETGELIEDNFSDDSVIEEVLSVVEEIVGDVGPFCSSDDLFGDEDDLDVVALLEGIGQIYENLGSSADLSIEINSGDSFVFNLGDVEITKMFGQTVSLVTGEGNSQTVINGPSISTTESLSSSRGNLPVVETNDDDEAPDEGAVSLTDRTAPAGLAGSALGFSGIFDGIADFFEDVFGDNEDNSPSIVIDSGDSFVFDIDDVEIVKLFGQTVSYVNGTDNEQTVTNGASIEESAGTSNSPIETAPTPTAAIEAASALSAPTQSVGSETTGFGFGNLLGGIFDFFEGLFSGDDDDGPTILIDSGDSFDFDLGSVEVVKMFGQTVSYASGEGNTQTVINGSDTDIEENQSLADDRGFDAGAVPFTEESLVPGVFADEATSEDSDETLEILEAVSDLLAARDDDSPISIVINSGDTFTFDIEETSIVKMFGQTVSYVTGEDNVQDVTNGASISESSLVLPLLEDSNSSETQSSPAALAELPLQPGTEDASVGITGTDDDNFLFGSFGNDVINAAGGDDTVLGLSGDDTISGGAGNDAISGGEGNDDLWGGEGDDVFIFGAGDGSDTIHDFETGSDRIDATDAGVTLLSQLTIEQTSEGALIGFANGTGPEAAGEAGGDQVLLVGIQADDLSANDFAFS